MKYLRRLGTTLLWWIGALILSCENKLPGQGFPRDAADHAMLTGDYIGADSAQAVWLVSHYLNDAVANYQMTIACAYGRPVKMQNRDTGVQLDSLVYEPTLTPSGPACDSVAVGFFVFLPPSVNPAERAQLATAMEQVVRGRNEMVFAALVYGTAPVPAALAHEQHWPLMVPRLDAHIYAPPRHTKDT